MNPTRRLMITISTAFLVGCSGEITAADRPATQSPPIDLVQLFVRDTREFPGEEVEIVLARTDSGSTLTVFRPERDWRPRLVLDSIGPGAQEPEEITRMLASYDLWMMAAPGAPGGACVLVNGQLSCSSSTHDYTLVMGVRSDGVYRAQRYTHLESTLPIRPVHALGDYVLAWARRLEAQR